MMKNPFKQLKHVGKALKIGYGVLQRYQQLEQIGLVPELRIKGIPIRAIDDAAESFVGAVRAEQAKKKPQPDRPNIDIPGGFDPGGR
jgi:hypothetical protein